MKCPLLGAIEFNSRGRNLLRNADCLKEECAWWDEAHECCAMIALNQTFVVVGNVLGHLVDKMPHEAQFRK